MCIEDEDRICHTFQDRSVQLRNARIAAYKSCNPFDLVYSLGIPIHRNTTFNWLGAGSIA